MAKKRARTIAELEGLIRDFLPDPERTIQSLDKALLRVGNRLISNVKLAHKWQDRTGRLSQSHYVKRRGPLEIAIGNDAATADGKPYAKFLHDGTGIYGPKKRPITPKKADYLQFKLPNGQWVRTKSVKGVKPMKWLTKEWQKERPRTVDDIRKVILAEAGF